MVSQVTPDITLATRKKAYIDTYKTLKNIAWAGAIITAIGLSMFFSPTSLIHSHTLSIATGSLSLIIGLKVIEKAALDILIREKDVYNIGKLLTDYPEFNNKNSVSPLHQKINRINEDGLLEKIKNQLENIDTNNLSDTNMKNHIEDIKKQVKAKTKEPSKTPRSEENWPEIKPVPKSPNPIVRETDPLLELFSDS